MGWINQISPIGDDILQAHMPRAYDAGLRYPLRTAMEEVKQAHPFLSHDIGARRSKALGVRKYAHRSDYLPVVEEDDTCPPKNG